MSLRIVQAVDPAIGLTHRADYFVMATVGMEWAIQGRPIFILDIFRDRITFPEQPRVIESQFLKWQPFGAMYVAIESIFYQSALIQAMRIRGRVPIREINRRLGNRVSPDKETRAASLQARYEQGQIHHPPNAPWLDDFEEELLSFPRGEHDDQVDAVVDAVDALTLGPGWAQTAASYMDFVWDPSEAGDDTGLYADLGVGQQDQDLLLSR